MKVLKPEWVTHGGKPIFSIDIHPEGSRFATGGQGENCGKVVIWNMAPVRNEKDEENDKVPSMLSQLDNHLACVNCVRWSQSGKLLASGGDDKLIMLWQLVRTGVATPIFGSEEKVNVESWRCVNTLRGHAGDILDLNWAPHDVWLASCSVDNVIIIWSGTKLEQVTVIRGHSGMVKGVAWDPLGKYLASQSDDKTVRVWRTLDWKEEVSVKEPFQECRGTTHVLRLGWSPDAKYIISAHAMNNGGPTAQVIERDGWKCSMDCVGHRKAITCVRFSNVIYSKKFTNKSSVNYFSAFAIGSKDRGISVWMTAKSRPLVVIKDVFDNSFTDISWDAKGLQLMACSLDGTVAYIAFDDSELGTPLSLRHKEQLHRKLYGQVAQQMRPTTTIIESTAMLQLQQDKLKEKKALQISSPAARLTKNAEILQSREKQIETKTPDGKRRITPIMLETIEFSEPIDESAETAEPVFLSSTEQSKIVVEKQILGGCAQANIYIDPHQFTVLSPLVVHRKNTPVKESHAEPSKIKGRGPGRPPKLKPDSGTSESPQPAKRGPGRPRRIQLSEVLSSSPVTTPVELEVPDAPATPQLAVPLPPILVTAQKQNIGYTPVAAATPYAGLILPVPKVSHTLTILLSDLDDCIIEVNNSSTHSLYQVYLINNTQRMWSSVIGSRVIIATASKDLVCLACEDFSLVVLATATGLRILPTLCLGSQVSHMKCCDYHVLVVTSHGMLSLWDFEKLKKVISNRSVDPILKVGDTISEVSLPAKNTVTVSLSSGLSFALSVEMDCWQSLSDRSLLVSSELHSCLSLNQIMTLCGPLASLQTSTMIAKNARSLGSLDSGLQSMATQAFIESQLVNCIAVGSGSEYEFWMATYVRYLVLLGCEKKLRHVFEELLGPIYPSKSSKWKSEILGIKKREILSDVLPLLGSNLQLQRLFSEFHDQLQDVNH